MTCTVGLKKRKKKDPVGAHTCLSLSVLGVFQNAQ